MVGRKVDDGFGKEEYEKLVIDELNRCPFVRSIIERFLEAYRFIEHFYNLCIIFMCIKKRNDSLYSSLAVGILNVERRMTRPK